MCQRQIIFEDESKHKNYTVPLMNGCDCPMIKEFHHIETNIFVSIPQPQPQPQPKSTSRKHYQLPNCCFDMHTNIPIQDVPDHHVVFRNCICLHPSGLCMILPPLLYQPDLDTADVLDEDDPDPDPDEDAGENYWGGNMGIRPRI